MQKCTISGWIVKSEPGFLYFFRKKPNRVQYKGEWGYWESEMYDDPFEINEAFNFDISWENEPKKAELTIKLK